MPTVHIDGKAYEFEGRHRLLQFCIDNGIEIPYFCYHPAMSVPTNCRMCLVEAGTQARDRATGEWVYEEDGSPKIMWGRKPATACNYPLGDRLYVKTHRTSETIKKAQEGVLEFMLVNHPLDCPICDQAGECPLQIWTYKYGPEGSRFETTKVHKKKHVDLGPRVVLDEERCINCTRCTRFTEEISKSDQLTIVGRGDKNCPSTAPGQTFDDPYSMNTIDICPVGALTSKAHRFKARVWEMAHAPAIDMNDATGTNVFVWLRDNEVLRFTPRHNEEINDYWMPDAHRLNVDYYNKNRASGVKITGDLPVDFESGLNKAADLLKDSKKVLFIGSAYESLESNWALQQLAQAKGSESIYYIPHVEEGYGDGWLISDDRTPNAASCELLGFKAAAPSDIQELARTGGYDLIYSLENGRLFTAIGESLDSVNVVAHATHQQEAYEKCAAVLLPAATSLEGEATYISAKGIAQVSTLAKQFKQMRPEQWMQLPKSRLDKGAVAVDRWRNLENIFDVLPSWLLVSKVATLAGHEMPYQTHKEIFAAIKPQFEVLADLKVSYKPPKSAFKSTQLEFAPVWGAR